jgi:hypothetical protein
VSFKQPWLSHYDRVARRSRTRELINMTEAGRYDTQGTSHNIARKLRNPAPKYDRRRAVDYRSNELLDIVEGLCARSVSLAGYSRVRWTTNDNYAPANSLS